MKKIVSILILAGLAYYILVYNKTIVPRARIFFTESVCDIPLTYRIIRNDPQFNVSTDTFASDIQQATQKWAASYGKTLFTPDPKGDIQISFVYDKRQSLTTQINSMEGKIQTDDTNMKARIAAYEAKVNDFNNRLTALNNEIDSWNNKGGAPADVYARLKKEQQDLQNEAVLLNQESKNLNLSSQNFNIQVAQLNNTINSFNSTIQQKPEEGLYDPNNDNITIYFYNNHDELIHTLMHELGHARGMQHESDPNAIMYAYTTQKTVPSAADLSQLQTICQQKYYQYEFQRYTYALRTYIQSLIKSYYKGK